MASACTFEKSEAKIDAAIALLMAIGRAQASDDGSTDMTQFLLNPVMG